MHLQKQVWFISIFIVLFIGGCTISGESNTKESGITDCVKAGGAEIMLQTPHPYPLSKEGTTPIWTETIEQENVQRLRAHVKTMKIKSFQKGHVNSYNPQTGERGEREEILPVTFRFDQLDSQQTANFMEWLKNNWVGDYIVVRDHKNNPIIIMGGDCENSPTYPAERCKEGFWIETAGNKLTFELYADEKYTDYGILLDKYDYCEEVLPQASNTIR